MAQSRMSQTVIAFSTAPEDEFADVGDLISSAADFTPVVTKARILPVPDQEKITDEGVVGNQQAGATYTRNGFAIPLGFEFSDTVNVTSFPKILRRWLGTPVADQGYSAYETNKAGIHTLYELDPQDSLQLPSTAWVYKNNGFDFLDLGVLGSTLQLTQAGAGDPQFVFGMLSSGRHKIIEEFEVAFGSLGLPAAQRYCYGAKSSLIFTDNVGTRNFTTPAHKLRSFSFNANNNLIPDDTRAGMPQVDPDDPALGWYRDFLLKGDTDSSGEFSFDLESDRRDFENARRNRALTSLEWLMVSDPVPAVTTPKDYSVKLTVPKFNLRTPRADEAGLLMAQTYGIFPLINSSFYGKFSFEIVDAVLAKYDA